MTTDTPTLNEEIEYLRNKGYYRNTIERSTLQWWYDEHQRELTALRAENERLLAKFALAAEDDAGRDELLRDLQQRAEAAEAALKGWLDANAPGGWIDDLRQYAARKP